MAPITADPNCVKSSRCSNPSGEVRIIGKIRGLTDRESENRNLGSKPWITVKKSKKDGSSEKSTVFLESQSTSRMDGYELDCCYEQHEEIDHIYSREIQPMVSEVFNGQNASVIALGARGSGKTYTIQGSQEKPGLAVIAMSEILTKAKELGKSVYISLYELTQEHAKDLLNPDHPTIQVLEDARGKIILKGLSQVPVKSMSEFHDMYFSRGSLQNTQKLSTDQPRNKGLMVHISSEKDKLQAKPANKISFVDLAGYEDPRKSSRDGITPVESNRNKLLYALLNVVNAIAANEIRVPYRESKLTRILQDSLGGTSHVLLITCLNPFFCQDSLSFMSLVSRTCRSIKQVLTDSTNRSQSSTKVKVLPSSESGKALSGSLSVKKQIGHSRHLLAKKANCIVKGRKLFDEVKTVNYNQLRYQSEDTSTQKSKILPDPGLADTPFSLEEARQDKSNLECSPKEEHIEDVNVEERECQLQNITFPSVLNDKLKTDPSSQTGPNSGTNSNEEVPMHLEAGSTCEENNFLYWKDDGSPPLSEKIREISNNLKSLCASTSLKIKMPEDVVAPYSQLDSYEIAEPKTPVVELSVARCCSPNPRGTFSNRSSGVKHSLVQGYLNFLNSANKEELKSLKGIGEKRATYILELREESPEPFKSVRIHGNFDTMRLVGVDGTRVAMISYYSYLIIELDDLEDIGLSAKQIKGMMKQAAGDLFT